MNKQGQMGTATVQAPRIPPPPAPVIDLPGAEVKATVTVTDPPARQRGKWVSPRDRVVGRLTEASRLVRAMAARLGLDMADVTDSIEKARAQALALPEDWRPDGGARAGVGAKAAREFKHEPGARVAFRKMVRRFMAVNFDAPEEMLSLEIVRLVGKYVIVRSAVSGTRVKCRLTALEAAE